MTQLIRTPIHGYQPFPYLPESQRPAGGIELPPVDAAICTEQAQEGDLVLVLEKLDGVSVGIARKYGELSPINGIGNTLTERAKGAEYKLFFQWFRRNRRRFTWLGDGERVMGEWLAQAHGTRYNLVGTGHAPLVVVDIAKSNHWRAPYSETVSRCADAGLECAEILYMGGAVPVEDALARLSIDGLPVLGGDTHEGVVYRVERRRGVRGNVGVETLAQYVRHEHRPHRYLPGFADNPATMPILWNWNAEIGRGDWHDGLGDR